MCKDFKKLYPITWKKIRFNDNKYSKKLKIRHSKKFAQMSKVLIAIL